MDVDLSAEALAAVVLHQYDDPEEAWRDYERVVIDGPPADALAITVALVGAASADDGALCWIGVNFVEPLLDLHWRAIGDPFVEAATRLPALRKAMSCAWLDFPGNGTADSKAPEQRFYDLVGPSDDIGRQKS